MAETNTTTTLRVNDGVLARNANALFRGAPIAEKLGNYVAAFQNTTGRPLTYHVTNARGETAERVIPPGMWAKVSPQGELNVQIHPDGKSSFEQHNNPAHMHSHRSDAAAAAKELGVKLVTAQQTLDKALAELRQSNPGVRIDENAVKYVPERNRVQMVRVPPGMLLEIEKPSWDLTGKSLPVSTVDSAKGGVLQRPVGTTDIYGNSATGTLKDFMLNGRPATEMMDKIPVADRAHLEAAARATTQMPNKAAIERGVILAKKSGARFGVLGGPVIGGTMAAGTALLAGADWQGFKETFRKGAIAGTPYVGAAEEARQGHMAEAVQRGFEDTLNSVVPGSGTVVGEFVRPIKNIIANITGKEDLRVHNSMATEALKSGVNLVGRAYHHLRELSRPAGPSP